MTKSKRFVITGGPGFGKTSIITELEKRGYYCFHEISRSIIKEQLAIGGDIVPWKNLEAFSRIVIEKRQEQYEEGEKRPLSFYDRGIPDVIAYMIKDNLELPNKYMTKLEDFSYDEIAFVTPPWKEIFVNDGERKESYEDACSAHQIICETYAQLGYKLVDIPKTDIVSRVDFIVKHVNN